MEPDGNFYNRISDFGEYQFNLIKSTIFVYQLTFIVLLALIMFYYFNRMGYISTPNFWFLSLLLVSILVIIYINRYVIMPKIRDKNNFDRLNFGDNTLSPTIPVESGGVVGGTLGPPPPTVSCTSVPNPVPTPAPICTQDPSIY
jgi:hypothetical protein